MIRHVVLIRWSRELDTASLQSINEGFGKLPAQIPEIKRYLFGPDWV